MINGGKIIGKASPLGDSGKLSRAATKQKNDVATRQAAEGMDRNAAIYKNTDNNVSQSRTGVEQQLKSEVNPGSGAGYEGGKSTHIEMNGTGYAGAANGKPRYSRPAASRASANPRAAGALPILFNQTQNSFTDYRKFKGNLR